jgi:type IV secretion system protein VirB9
MYKTLLLLLPLCSSLVIGNVQAKNLSGDEAQAYLQKIASGKRYNSNAAKYKALEKAQREANAKRRANARKNHKNGQPNHYQASLGYTPHAGRIDHRLKKVVYDIRNVVNLRGFYGYQTHIEFSPNEKIMHIALGDSEAWQVVPNGNHLFIKPSADNASTNMTVLTDSRTYNFDLDAQRNVSKRERALTYGIFFVYPQDALRVRMDKINTQRALSTAKFNSEIIPNRVFNPAKINWKYTRGGSDTLAPVRVFDDGQFTYFQFDEKKTIPAIFSVGADKKESLINFHKKGNFYVVQKIASQFSLRSDSIVSCVFNDAFSDAVNSEVPRKKASFLSGMFNDE